MFSRSLETVRRIRETTKYVLANAVVRTFPTEAFLLRLRCKKPSMLRAVNGRFGVDLHNIARNQLEHRVWPSIDATERRPSASGWPWYCLTVHDWCTDSTTA